MKHLRQHIRNLIIESTEYDSKFSSLMDSGYEGILQAMELADSFGMPTQELPWTLRHVETYVDTRGPEEIGHGYGNHMEKLLEPTGWSLEKWNDELGKREDEVFKRFAPK